MLTPTEKLKIRLMTDGLALSTKARVALAGVDNSRPLTLSDYASTSGIAIRLEGEIWVNAPIADFNPNFVGEAPHRLDCDADGFFVESHDQAVRAEPFPVPSYHDETDAAGRKYTDFAITHTDRVRISPVQGCTYACTFCDMSYKRRYERMSLQGLWHRSGERWTTVYFQRITS